MEVEERGRGAQYNGVNAGRINSKIVRTMCDLCHCECGVLAHVRNGKVEKVEGDPNCPINDGSLCPKGLAVTQLLYHPDRIRYPLKRTGKRGEGRWQRITWDEALDTATTQFRDVMEKYGPESITYSWGDAAYRNSRFTKDAWLFAMKSPTHFHSDAHYCFHPVAIANRLTFGHLLTSEGSPDYRNSRCIILWGGNPIMSHPTQGKDIMIGKKNGAKLIVVDPRFTEIASKADIFLQVRPGTDDALALGMLNVIINKGLYDKEFVDTWCVGFDELKERVQKYSPRWTSEITWIDEEKIIQTAWLFARSKPAATHTRMGVCMSTNSIQTIRAVSVMAAICGNLDVRGGNLISNRPVGFKTRAEIVWKELLLAPELENKRIGAHEFPLLCSAQSLGGNHCHPPSVIHAMITGKPYPIKALWVLNDLLLCLEGAHETNEALKNVKFMVGSDFFMTPTMELCDLILPPCTYLEREEVVESICTANLIGARQKVIEPMYETRNEKEIDLEIIKRMGLQLPAHWQSVKKFNDYRVSGMGITFDDLKEKGYIAGPIRYKKYEETGFPTPSGKVELYSSTLRELGYDPLPYYEENPETPVSAPEIARDYPLILITGGRHVVYFHSLGRQIPWLREIEPDPHLEIHPETATQLGVKDGDWVWIETPRGKGRIRMRAELTEAVCPQAVHAPSHWWFPDIKKADHGCWDSNINALMSNDPPYDPICGATPLRGSLCRVYKADDDPKR
jgi:anaerobic selenocysteine-containing dehydrogenase